LDAPNRVGYPILIGIAENITDSRCASLGHNTTIAPQGVTALFYNPGRLARLPRIQVSMGMRAHWGSFGEDMSNEYIIDNYKGEYPFHLKVNHLTLAMPIPPATGDLQVIIGAGYRTVWDRGYKQEMSHDFLGQASDGRVSKGGYSVITGGAALDYKREIGIGASFSMPFWSNIKIEQDDYVENGDISGSFITLGGYANMAEDINVAVTWRQAIEFDIESELEHIANPPRYERTISYPARFSFGGEYRPSESFAVMIEYQTRLFSEVKIATQRINPSRSRWEEEDILNDGSALKAGLDLGFLQLGAYQESIFVPDKIYSQDPVSKQPAILEGYSVGFGSESVHLSFEYRSYTTQTGEYDSDWMEELYLLRLTVNQMFD